MSKLGAASMARSLCLHRARPSGGENGCRGDGCRDARQICRTTPGTLTEALAKRPRQLGTTEGIRLVVHATKLLKSTQAVSHRATMAAHA